MGECGLRLVKSLGQADGKRTQRWIFGEVKALEVWLGAFPGLGECPKKPCRDRSYGRKNSFREAGLEGIRGSLSHPREKAFGLDRHNRRLEKAAGYLGLGNLRGLDCSGDEGPGPVGGGRGGRFMENLR